LFAFKKEKRSRSLKHDFNATFMVELFVELLSLHRYLPEDYAI